MRIGKQDIEIIVSDKTSHTKQSVHEIITAFMDTIAEKIANGDDVVIPGFGSWKLQAVAERKARNMHTDETITIPAHNRVKFSPGKDLKDSAASFGSKKVNLTKPPKN